MDAGNENATDPCVRGLVARCCEAIVLVRASGVRVRASGLRVDAFGVRVDAFAVGERPARRLLRCYEVRVRLIEQREVAFGVRACALGVRACAIIAWRRALRV